MVKKSNTEHKKAEDALEKQKEEYQIIFESVPQGIWYKDKENRFLRVNKAAAESAGLSIEDIEGKTAYELFPEDAEKYYRDDLEVINSGKPKLGIVERMIVPGGGTKWVSTDKVLYWDDEGNVAGVIVFVTDITEHKKAEVALRESEAQYRELFENANDVVYTHDLKGNFTSLNKAALHILGYMRAEVLKMNVMKIVVPEYRELTRRMIESKVKNGIPTRYELEIIAKDGHRVPLEVSTRLIYHEGKPSEVQGIARDITERKRAEETIKRKLMRFNLEEGNIYLVKETTPSLSIEAFKDISKVGYKGLVLSRTPAEEFKRGVENDFEFLWLAERRGKKVLSPKLSKIEPKIEKLPRKSAVLIDSLDYLVFKNGFEKTLSFVQGLRELAYFKRHVVILAIDPSILSKRELRLLEKETKEVEPTLRVRLPESLLEILRFIYMQNNIGVKPSYTDFGLELGVSKPTGRKRIRHLISAGYVRQSKRGNTKVLELTERGRVLFMK